MRNAIQILKEKYGNGEIDYGHIYDFIEGWFTYAKNANTYKPRKNIGKQIEKDFQNELSSKEISKHLKILLHPNKTINS